MNLDTIATIANIMASGAVVLTLVFIGLQLRQNAHLTRMAAAQTSAGQFAAAGRGVAAADGEPLQGHDGAAVDTYHTAVSLRVQGRRVGNGIRRDRPLRAGIATCYRERLIDVRCLVGARRVCDAGARAGNLEQVAGICVLDGCSQRAGVATGKVGIVVAGRLNITAILWRRRALVGADIAEQCARIAAVDTSLVDLTTFSLRATATFAGENPVDS